MTSTVNQSTPVRPTSVATVHANESNAAHQPQHWLVKSKNSRLARVRERLCNLHQHPQQQAQGQAPTFEWTERLDVLEQRFSVFEAQCRPSGPWIRVLGFHGERQRVELFQAETDYLLDQLEFGDAPAATWFEELCDSFCYTLLLE